MKHYQYSQTLMGTCVSLTLFTQNNELANKLFVTIKRLEDKLTVNRPESDVMAINHAAGIKPIKVSPFIFNLIAQAKQVSLAEKSCFNLAIGALVKLWKIGFQGNKVPSNEQIQQRLLLTDPNLIELDEKNYAVFLQKAGMEIDLGAIAKGYIADVVKTLLTKHHICHAIINLGGNVLTVGDSPFSDDGYWRVGIQTPFVNGKQPLGMIKVKNKSVVTSGIYERFFVHNERIYHHILNPKTGYPLDNELESVTIISKRSLEGDIYSTYLYGLGIENAKLYLKCRPNIAAIFIQHNRQITLMNIDRTCFELLDNRYDVVY